MSWFSRHSLCETLDCQSLKDQAHFTDGKTEAEDETWNPAASLVHLISPHGHIAKTLFWRRQFSRGSTQRYMGQIVFTTARLGDNKHRRPM